MEAMTDFATVRFFSVPTISEGVVRIWTSGSASARGEATELAGLLLVMAIGLIVLERALRGKSRFYQPGGRTRRLPRLALAGGHAWAAVAVCAAILTCAFFIPVGQLVLWVINEVSIPGSSWQTVYGQYIGTSFGLSGAAAAVTVVLALVLAQARRTASGRSLTIQRGAMRVATLGYALPGAVIAAGVLLTLSPLDHLLHDLAALWGANLPLLLTGSITGLVYAYVVRFMSVAYNSVDASMQKIKPSLEGAARCMGAGRGRILWRIHAPLVSGGMAAGGLLVFVDAMKELPATLLLRPFGMDTLAVWTYMLAVESFWQAAALPALTILAVGLIPVALLMRLR
jgi:iron(III) transport system permease protein